MFYKKTLLLTSLIDYVTTPICYYYHATREFNIDKVTTLHTNVISFSQESNKNISKHLFSLSFFFAFFLFCLLIFDEIFESTFESKKHSNFWVRLISRENPGEYYMKRSGLIKVSTSIKNQVFLMFVTTKLVINVQYCSFDLNRNLNRIE